MTRNNLQSSSKIDEATNEILEELQQSIQPWVTTLITRAPGQETNNRRHRSRLVRETILPVWEVIQSLSKNRRARPIWYDDLEFKIGIIKQLHTDVAAEWKGQVL